jgi:hypothetical protein
MSGEGADRGQAPNHSDVVETTGSDLTAERTSCTAASACPYGAEVPHLRGMKSSGTHRARSARDHCERRSNAADAIAQCLGHLAWLG